MAVPQDADGRHFVTLGGQRVAFGQETLSRFPSLGQYSGQRVIVGVRPEDFEDAAITNAVARFSPRSRVRADDVFDIAVSTDNLHFFDAQTGERIH